MQAVSGKLASNQSVQRDRDMLGGVEIIPHGHREAKVEHQHGSRTRGLFRFIDFKISDLKFKRNFLLPP